ncbi:MAG: nicotinate-nucleotide adenylyltransferase [Actinobacteria bacterium]|nr:nicotinate-nucleotide adenylyltransferase [Actinomycetota bacterium]
MRVGLFGGTFDPPHLGHLVTAVNVRNVLKLDIVILMVANDPWQKHATREVASAVDRLAMVRAAIKDVDGLVAGDDEITRGGPSFTADTLTALSVRYPGAALFTIVGDDAAAKFGTWQRSNEIAKLSTFQMKSPNFQHWLLLTDLVRRLCRRAISPGTVSRCQGSK